MTDTQEKYERAVRYRDSIGGKIKNGMSEQVQKQLEAATDEVIKYRNKLVEEGDWNGPRVIPVKAKYRGK